MTSLTEINSFKEHIKEIASIFNSNAVIKEDLYDVREKCEPYINTCKSFNFNKEDIYEVECEIEDIVRDINFILECSRDLSEKEVDLLCKTISEYSFKDDELCKTTESLVEFIITTIKEIYDFISKRGSYLNNNSNLSNIDNFIEEVDNTIAIDKSSYYNKNDVDNPSIMRANYGKEKTKTTPTGFIYSCEGEKIGMYSYPIKSSECGNYTDINVILKTSGMTDEEVEELFNHEFLSDYARDYNKELYKKSLSELRETALNPKDIDNILHLQNGFLPPKVIFISIAWGILDCIDLRIDRIHELSFDTLREKADYVLECMKHQHIPEGSMHSDIAIRNLFDRVSKNFDLMFSKTDDNFVKIKSEFWKFIITLKLIFSSYKYIKLFGTIEQEYECINRLKELYRYIQYPNIEPNYISKFSVELVESEDDIVVGMPTVEW